jgi:hypothetical protein
MDAPRPHPDCRAPHREANDYSGPTHACAGDNCQAPEHADPAAAARADHAASELESQRFGESQHWWWRNE